MNFPNFECKSSIEDRKNDEEGREYDKKIETNSNRWRSDFVRDEILMYREQELLQPQWVDISELRSKLLIEFKAYIKVPILSEEAASRILVSKSSPEMCKILDNIPEEDRLEPDDIRLSYWYWSCIAKSSESAIDDRICCSVIIKNRKNNPSEMRPSWALPSLVIVEETRYAFPLIECLKRRECGCCTGYALPDGRTCMLDLDEKNFNYLKYKNPSDYQIILINYRVFDSVVPNWVIRLCFDVLMQKLDFATAMRDNGREEIVTALENKRRFEMVVKYFLKLPIKVLNPCGCLYRIEKARGIPLGSCFSDLIRTMSNFVMTRIVCSTIVRERPCLQRFHGSKCMLTFDSSIEFDLDAFSRCAEGIFGIVVDTNRTCKTANIEDLHVLRYCCDDEND